MASNWTVDTSQALILALIKEKERLIEERFKAQELRHTYTEKLFNDQINALTLLLDTGTKRLDKDEGKSAGLNVAWAYLTGAVGLIILIAQGLIMYFRNA